jgi:hypothetical protein
LEEQVGLPYFFARKRKWGKAKYIILFPLLIILSLLLLSCIPGQEVVVQEEAIPTDQLVEKTLEGTEVTLTATEEVAVIEEEAQVPEEPEVVETSTEIPVVKPKSFVGEYNMVTIHGAGSITPWYQSFLREAEVVECPKPCSTEQIDDNLDPVGNEFRLVQNGWVIYTHSGWPVLEFPHLGKYFLVAEEAGDLVGLVFCLDADFCFKVTDYVILDREQIGGSVSVAELFESHEGSYFLSTCATRTIPGLPTPKLILQLTLIQ